MAVVLKGAGTVISGAGAPGDQHLGHPGAGDRRAPATCSPESSARCSRKGSTPLEAGALGAYLHGRAGEAAAARAHADVRDRRGRARVPAGRPSRSCSAAGSRLADTIEEDDDGRSDRARHHDADPMTVESALGVTEAARLMVDQGIGAMPVVDGGKLVGLVTEGDLIMKDVRLEYPDLHPPARRLHHVSAVDDAFRARAQEGGRRHRAATS